MTSDYQKLRKEFDRKVEELQNSCKHESKSWCEHWWALGHSSGYKVLICNNCLKELEEKPDKKAREAEEQAWLEEQMEMAKELNKKK